MSYESEQRMAEEAAWEDEYNEDCCNFADPGGHSALRASSPSNPRDCSCPTCGAENVLTREDALLGYQCDACADRAENPWMQY